MSLNSRKRRAETQIISGDEAEQTHEEEKDKQHCQMISHYAIPDIPSHIVFDILSRLPIKALFNCRRVCKLWLSLIAETYFAKFHFSRSQVGLLAKAVYDKRESRKLHLVDLQIAPYTHPRDAGMKLAPKINLPKNPGIPIMLNSCNGLLCLCEPETNEPIYVCNPILGEYITLPKCSTGTICGCGGSAFGFSSITNQYKVVRSSYRVAIDPVTGLQMSGDYDEAEIYTIGEGLWRSIGKIPYTIVNDSFDSLLNGAFHWLDFDHSRPELICCFDFGSEQFQVVPEPSEFVPLEKHLLGYMRVGVLRGCLSICDFSKKDHVAIWVMKDYGVKESWSKDLVIENIYDRKEWDCYEPIMILKNGKILMLFNRNALLLYDPMLECFEDVHIYGIGSDFHGISHVPSLVSLRDVAKGENLKMCRA